MRAAPEQRAFLWQTLLVLVPVGVLALLAALAVRKDRARVEQEARSLCRVVAENLGQSLFHAVDQRELFCYAKAQARWFATQQSAFGLTRIPTVLSPDEFAAEQLLDDWLKAHPKIDFQTLPQALWNSFADNGLMLHPRDYDSPPRMAPWLLELPDQARRAWQLAEEAVNAGAGDSRAKIEAFLEASPGTDAAANAAWLRLIVETRATPPLDAGRRLIDFGREQGNIRTASGLPLAQAAWLRALQVWPQEVFFPLWAGVPIAVQDAPSILIPELLNQLARLSSKQNETTRRLVKLLRSVWAADEQTRRVLHAFRRQHPPATWTNSSYWVQSELGAFLANGRRVARPDENLAATNTVPVAAFTVSLYPKMVVEQAFLEAFANANAALPFYARARVQVAGEELDLHPGSTFRPVTRTNDALLAEYSLPFPPSYLPGVFKVEIDLADPALLFARQRQLTLGFIAVILLAALAAAFGWWQSWRTLRRQIELNEMKSNFVSSVSHELRAPIASVRLMAEGLEAGRVCDEPKRAEYFKFIVQECRRLTSLIENVLDFSRIEEGRKQYDFEPVDPVALLQQTVNLMQTYTTERGVRLVAEITSTKLSTRDIQLLADGRALQQALVNLIDNAIKHSPQGDVVTVGLSVESLASDQGRQILKLSVSDRGPGIPSGEHERIFERFYRRGAELRRETQGVGIGLSIVKHIVEAHGGHVRVDSAPGKGSRFTIELPMGGTNEPTQS